MLPLLVRLYMCNNNNDMRVDNEVCSIQFISSYGCLHEKQMILMMMMVLTAPGDSDFTSSKKKEMRMNERNWIENSTF